jgi:hypothetical protein
LPPTNTPAIAAYTPDLMDRSKISAAWPDCRFVARPEALVGLAGIDVIVVDLSKRGVVESLVDIVAGGARVVGYGAHVDHKLLAAAEAAGVTDVLPRSKFFTRLAAGDLLGG